MVVEVRVAQVRHISLYGGGGAVAVEREVVQGQVPAARSVVEVRVAQARLNSQYGGGGAVAVEREVVQDQVPAECTVVARESSQGEARLSVRPAAVRLPWSVKLSKTKYQRRGV